MTMLQNGEIIKHKKAKQKKERVTEFDSGHFRSRVYIVVFTLHFRATVLNTEIREVCT